MAAFLLAGTADIAGMLELERCDGPEQRERHEQIRAVLADF
jgi:hypothetical protein